MTAGAEVAASREVMLSNQPGCCQVVPFLRLTFPPFLVLRTVAQAGAVSGALATSKKFLESPLAT